MNDRVRDLDILLWMVVGASAAVAFVALLFGVAVLLRAVADVFDIERVLRPGRSRFEAEVAAVAAGESWEASRPLAGGGRDLHLVIGGLGDDVHGDLGWDWPATGSGL